MSVNTGNKFDIIKCVRVTEKATKVIQDINAYTFIVDKYASKNQIKSAIESFFNVSVESVTTSNMHGKRKMFRGRLPGVRSSYKKAVVRLSRNDKIDSVVRG